jgi:hypothetical protein
LTVAQHRLLRADAFLERLREALANHSPTIPLLVLATIALESGVLLQQSSLIATCVRIDADSCMHALFNVLENAVPKQSTGVTR